MDNYASLVKEAANAEEVWEERRFQVYRSGKFPLMVTVSDQGPDVSGFRYSAHAEAEGENGEKIVSHGNADSTPEGALSNIHWWEFD